MMLLLWITNTLIQGISKCLFPGSVNMGERIGFSCLQMANKTQLCCPMSQNSERAFRDSLYTYSLTPTPSQIVERFDSYSAFLRTPQMPAVACSGPTYRCHYTVTHQLLGWDFSENTPGVVTFALAVGSLAGRLCHELSSTSKHMKALLTSWWVAV